MQIYISNFKKLTSKIPEREGPVEWNEFAALLTDKNNRKITPDKDAASLISFARFNGGRANDNVVEITAVALDCDNGPSFGEIRERIKNYEYIVYSTHNHTSSVPKYRIIFLLRRSISRDEYPALFEAANNLIGNIADMNAKDPARMSYLLSCPFETADIAFAYHNHGESFDPDNPPLSVSINNPPAHNSVTASILNSAGKAPDMTRGFPDRERTKALTERVGWCLGPKNMTKEETIKACLAWNQFNTPRLPEKKVRATVISINNKENKKRVKEGKPLAGTESITALPPLFDLSEARIDNWIDKEPPPRKWLLDKSLPQGKVGILVAPGGTGKSQLMVQLAASVALGKGVAYSNKGYAWNTPNDAAVLCLFAEEDEEELHRRLYNSKEQMSLKDYDKKILRQRLFMKSVVGENNLMTEKSEASKKVLSTQYAKRLAAVCQEITNLRLIIIDPASRFRGGEENSNDDATHFVKELEWLAKKTGATLLVVHHTGKSAALDEPDQKAARGASALVDGVRWACNLSIMTKDEAKRYGIPEQSRKLYLKLTVTKNNYAPPQEEPIWLVRKQHGYLEYEILLDSKDQSDEAVRTNIIQSIQKEILQGREYSKTAFVKAFGAKTGLFLMGEKSLSGLLDQLLMSGKLIERPPSASSRNVRSVLDVPKTTCIAMQ